MMMRNLILIAALTGCAGAQQTSHMQASATDCRTLSDADRELANVETLQRVSSVEPYKRRDLRTRATQQLTYTAGARLYVPAQQGWSAPYLQRVLACHAASGNASHANDPFDVQGSRISVVPRGTRYEITIAGNTREAGQQIWQRAQALEGNGHVEVHQLSQSSTTPTM
jgi:hypothetical protein